MQKIAIFLDRDGTLNVNTHYTHLVEDLYLCDDVPELFHFISLTPCLQPIVVTNQSGVARGYYTKEECLLFESKLIEWADFYARYDGFLEAEDFYHAWSTEDCYWRKPNPGMLLQACRDHNLIPGYMIGDKPTDVEAGIAAGCRRAFLITKEFTLQDCMKEIITDMMNWELTRGYFKHK